MVGVHVGQLTVNQHHDLVLAGGLLLPDVGRDDPLGLLPQSGVSVHLQDRGQNVFRVKHCSEVLENIKFDLKIS